MGTGFDGQEFDWERAKRAYIDRAVDVARRQQMQSSVDEVMPRQSRSAAKRRFLDGVRSGDVDAVPIEPDLRDVWRD